MSQDLLPLTAQIVAAYVAHHRMDQRDLPDLIATTYSGLLTAVAPKTAPVEEPPLVPAVPVKKSVTDEYIVCLEDGRKLKTLRRHLALLGMTPQAYRAKWGLSRDYPMTAPAYAAKRSALAKEVGLGRSRAAEKLGLVHEGRAA